MPPKVQDPEYETLKKEMDDLLNKIKEAQKQAEDTTLQQVCSGLADVPKVRVMTRKMLKGHINKVNSVHYSGDSRHCVTGSLDGKLIIWDTWTGNKIQVIPLRSSWVMSCAFAPSGNFVACGGMDNMCTVYDVNNRDATTGAAKMVRELAGYEGFLSSCRFIEDQKLVTGSGDMKICVWDLGAGKKINEWEGHLGDIVCISLSPKDNNRFLTSSVDKSIRLWDLRDPEACKQTFYGHDADVNSVCFHPSGESFVTCSEDKSARLFDIRSDQQIAVLQPPTTAPAYTSCGVSLSGRMVLAAADDNNVHIWDALKNQYNCSLSGHENRITSLSVAPSGCGVATCSWDMHVRVWG